LARRFEMPHYSERELEDVKRANRVEDLARACGCELKKHGVNKLVTRCLWHEEKTPSLVLDVVRNTFKCFGCGKSGDVIAWVMETEGRDFVSAVEKLSQGTGVRGQGSGDEGRNASTSPSKKSSGGKEVVFDPGGTGAELLEQTVEYYHQVGKESVELREYLVRRGLLPKDATEEILNAPGSILHSFGWGTRTGRWDCG
jgi:DNA primase